MSRPDAPAVEGPAAEASSAGLQRQLRTRDVVAIHLGTVLGSGVFIAPSAIAAVAPEPLAAAGLWALGAVVALAGALTYAEAGARVPDAGGFYAFYREAFGPEVAFAGGWAAYFVTFPASAAAIAVVLGRYASTWTGPLGVVGTASVAVVVSVGLSTVGMRTGPRSQQVLTIAKVAVLVVVCVAAWAGASDPDPSRAMESVAAARDASSSSSSEGPKDLVALWSMAGLVLLWTYDGWSNVSLLAGEVRRPETTLVRAVVVGTGLLFGLYLLVQGSVTALLPAAVAAASESVFADAAAVGLGAGASKVVSALVVLSTFGSVAATLFAGARIGYAMGVQRQLPAAFARIDPRWGTPAVASTGLGALTLLYLWSGSFDALLSLFSFSVWIFYALVAVALLRFRKRGVGGDRVAAVPGGPLAPMLVLVTAVVVTGSSVWSEPVSSGLGLLVLVAALPAWRWIDARRQSRAPRVDGAAPDA